jgi:hypothetical protein
MGAVCSFWHLNIGRVEMGATSGNFICSGMIYEYISLYAYYLAVQAGRLNVLVIKVPKSAQESPPYVVFGVLRKFLAPHAEAASENVSPSHCSPCTLSPVDPR